MKNKTRITGLVRVATCSFIFAAMTACEAEDFTRTAGSLPDEETLTSVSGVLHRSMTPEQISFLKLNEEKPTEDAILYRLNQPANADISVSVEIDETLVEEYNKDQVTKLTLFPVEHVLFPQGKSLTVAKGAKVSDRLNISLTREGVKKGMYLLPLRAKIGKGASESTDKSQIIYYRVIVSTNIPATDLDAYPFKIVSYLNTEQMNPLFGGVWTVTTFDDDFNDVILTWNDMVILRKASLKLNKSDGRVMLDLGSDFQHVLSNRDNYIYPLQRASRKVLFCITGSNTGLGFCNMTDAQIADFVYQIKYVTDTYELDGVNFFDMDAGYDKEGAPAVIPASYPKLIKATKEALKDKLVTVACDKESTEILATAKEGIEAGEYIDYAWSGIFDEVVDAYVAGSKLKPIAGLVQSKYGGLFLKVNDDATRYQLQQKLTPEVKVLYRETASANVFAFWDIPTNGVGCEGGPRDTYSIVTSGISDMDFEYDMKMYLMNTPEWGHSYGYFRKDW